MKRNRLNIIYFILIASFLILVFKLFDLTVINGKKYRDFSNNNRIKQINLQASRGKIYDRNGEVLATNEPNYSLIVYADRFNSVKSEIRNKSIQDLIRILDEGGENYHNDYHLEYLNFKYKNEEDYLNTSITPIDKVIDIIEKNNLIEEILNSKITVSGEYTFLPAKRLVNYLSKEDRNIPISLNTDDGLSFEFVKDYRYENLINNNEITSETDAKTYLIKYINSNKSLLNNIISHPLSRKITYDLLLKKNLQENLELQKIGFSFDSLFLEHKQMLHTYSKKIRISSDAKSDFINLVKENSLKTLLSKAYKKDNSLVIPASKLISYLEKEGIDTNLKYELKENNEVEIQYKDVDNSGESALNKLIEISKNKIDDFISSDEIKSFAQNSLFENNIYPRIYISKWKYTFKSDKEDLLQNKEKEITPEKLLLEEKNKYKIKSENQYLTFNQTAIYNMLNKQRYLSYMPITIAKNLDNSTLLKLEEKIPKTTGLEVSTQPSRYYPNNNLASHTLGYIGPISKDKIFDSFTENKKYDVNDFVGKTGLEESFEDTLRGSKGKKLVYTDVYGRTTNVIEETEPVPGNNLYTTIDINVQRDMQNIFTDFIKAINNGEKYDAYYGKTRVNGAPNAKVGGSIIMNVKTGEIIGMYSHPDFNPNMFVNGISSYNWKLLNKHDEKNDDSDIYSPRPLLNSIVQSANPPGSTFKTVTSLAALENGLDPNATINTAGYIQVGSHKFHELIYSTSGRVWGRINLYEALKVSSNYYYYALGYGSNPHDPSDNITKVTLDDINNITKKLGMHNKTNVEINIPNESSGSHPSLEGKKHLVRLQLKYFLDNNLKKYIINNKSEDEIESDKKIILSWLEKGSDMSRNEVIKSVSDLGYNAEKPLDGNRSGLADSIKYSYLNMVVWTKADSLNMVIGQGQNAYTPIQLARLVATIANKGKIPKPTLVKKIANFDDTKTIFENSSKFTESGIKKEYFEEVIKGMKEVSKTQYARRFFPIEIGSKTGTAELSLRDEKGNLRVLTSEMAFAPLDDPEIAVYTFIIDGGTSENTRVINNDIIYSYYKHVKKDPNFVGRRKDNKIVNPRYAFYTAEKRRSTFDKDFKTDEEIKLENKKETKSEVEE